MKHTQIAGLSEYTYADQYKEEAQKRWGHTDAYKQSQARTKNWTKEDYVRVAQEGSDISSELARVMDRGVEDTEVQNLIARHHAHIERFYDCPTDMYRGLGAMYADDPRFAGNYNTLREGLAEFMRDAIAYYCDRQTK